MNAPNFFQHPIEMKRCEQLAEAFYRVAEVNHYMVGVCDQQVTRNECDEAEQILIRLEYPEQPDRHVRATAALALNLLAHYRDTLV